MRALAGLLLIAGLLWGCGGAAPRGATTATAPAPAGATPTGEVPAAHASTGQDPVCATQTGMFGPFSLNETQASQRYGKNAATYADAPTTKDKAVEVCGIPASRQWLSGTTCLDGTPAKQNGRVGSVGSGGRCGSIIDLYTVTCPEGNYDVYIDIYMCGPDESLF